MKNTWLLLAVGGRRQHGGNDGYDDSARAYYSWDSTVPNHANVNVGDLVVLWDKENLLGASKIDHIEKRSGSKTVKKCAECGLSNIKERLTLTPTFRCNRCGATFEQPLEIEKEITSYQCYYESNWVDLFQLISVTHLRSLCESSKSQLSLRRLNWTRFSNALRRADLGIGIQLDELTGIE